VLSRTAPSTTVRPSLPRPRGPLSLAVLAMLHGEPPVRADPADADPYGDDLQLALYCCYELHYRGFAGVDEEREWEPGLLALRREMERVFERALRADVRPADGTLDEVAAEIDALLVEPVDGRGPSWHLRREGTLAQLREYVVHRSLYHLKEADPQAWVIARLDGPAKAALVSVEHDEYGAGDPDRMHARLFADMMSALGLHRAYGHYLDAAPAATLAEVNFMSLCGLHRRLRGALVGQFAAVELTSSPGSERLVRAMRRLGCPQAAVDFYDEHVEADAVHEQVVRRGVIAPLLAAEPDLAADVVLGIRGSGFLGDRFADVLLGAWAQGSSALRVPLPDAPALPGSPPGVSPDLQRAPR
jgi:pyrroloquinoline quinone (PQQ) biosynthesis protein C